MAAPAEKCIDVRITFDGDVHHSVKPLFVGELRNQLLAGGPDGTGWGMGRANVVRVDQLMPERP